MFLDLVLSVKSRIQNGLTKGEEDAEHQGPPETIDHKAFDQGAGHENDNGVDNDEKEAEGYEGNR